MHSCRAKDEVTDDVFYVYVYVDQKSHELGI